jgi:ATP-dependent RNA helicase MRH4
LHKRYPATRRLATPNLHAIPRRVALSVVDIDKIPYQGNRDLACAQVIYDIGKNALEDEGGEDGAAAELAADPQRQTPVKKVIVFVNEREKALELANFLALKGIDALAIHRDSDHRKQAEILSRFTTPHGHPSVTASTSTSSSSSVGPSTTARADAAASPPPGTRKLAHTTVLVTTDITSRGIDTYPVRDVILYDVPHTSIDFIHRLGRVGRMGRRGRGVVLVGKHDRKDIVKEVREGMFRGAALI